MQGRDRDAIAFALNPGDLVEAVGVGLVFRGEGARRANPLALSNSSATPTPRREARAPRRSGAKVRTSSESPADPVEAAQTNPELRVGPQTDAVSESCFQFAVQQRAFKPERRAREGGQRPNGEAIRAAGATLSCARQQKGALAPPLLPDCRPMRRPQRLENWKLARALRWPYFLRSTTRESRVRKPSFLSVGLSSGS